MVTGIITKSISNLGLYETAEEGIKHYGCEQEWYKTKWKRIAGCGPSTACNLLHYINSDKTEDIPKCKADLVSFMDEIWDYVTPTLQGLAQLSSFMTAYLLMPGKKVLI
jgi:hypothetical protein